MRTTGQKYIHFNDYFEGHPSFYSSKGRLLCCESYFNSKTVWMNAQKGGHSEIFLR